VLFENAKQGTPDVAPKRVGGDCSELGDSVADSMFDGRETAGRYFGFDPAQELGCEHDGGIEERGSKSGEDCVSIAD
jgi:hypothetical protein